MPLRDHLSSLVEPFALRAAREQSSGTPPPMRAARGAALAIGRQKQSAAELLWAAGNRADALRIAIASIDATVAAGVDGLGALARPAVESARAEARTVALPELDDEVTPEHAALFRRLVVARAAAERDLRWTVRSPREIALIAVARILAVVLGALALVAAAYFVLRTPEHVEPNASAELDEAHAASNVLDGDPDAEWLLPGRSIGWIDLDLEPPRRVAGVRLLNARSPGHEDRGTREYRVELWSGSTRVTIGDGEFPAPRGRQDWQAMSVSGSAIDRVRVLVRSYFGLGGGLAEVELIE